MSGNHGHGGGHAGGRHRWRLAVAFALVGGFFGVELVAGLLSQSLALLADAGHMAADVVTLGAALVDPDRDPPGDPEQVLAAARTVLHDQFAIAHATLQVETTRDRQCSEVDW